MIPTNITTLVKYLLYTSLVSSACTASAQQGQFIKDAVTGCMIWDDNYSPKDSVRWEGTCNNSYASGKGKLTWYQDGSVLQEYTGQMKNGKPEGKGKYIINNYGTISGNFSGGQLHGKGAMYLSNGGKLVGNFVQGDFLNLDDKYLALLSKEYTGIMDTTHLYEQSGGSKLFYYTLIPKPPIRAVLVLFPSTGETAENVISCTRDIMQTAYDHGIASVVMGSNHNTSLEQDLSAMSFFDTVFQQLVKKHQTPADKFVLCGLSLGGQNALQYTEMSRNNKYHTYIKPLAVIGVDPPVDMTDLYNNAKKKIAQYQREGDKLSDSKKAAMRENLFLIDYFTKLYGGSPSEFPDRYAQGSEFSRQQTDGGNAKYLVHVPVRLYCDPDIIWQLKNKGRDYYDMNAANLSAMANFLMQEGNTEVEFIPALGKGYRVDGTKHPHSWSIVEPKDCIRWIMNLAK